MSVQSALGRRLPRCQRAYSTSSHANFYSSLLPAMIPVALLGSAVYMGLHLVQSRLAHEKFLDEANERIRALEQQLDSLPIVSTSQHQAKNKQSTVIAS